MIRLRAGYDLKETSPLRAVSGSRIPTLFIHGEEDRMIPVEMCWKLYDAALCDKEIMLVEGAGHAQAADKDPQRYFEREVQGTRRT
jgi:pimeloyl-ACP methyl ester carboxylesterase